MSMSLAQMIAQQARQTGADPLTLLATAMVESNLNPRAVGDNGTSYGLFQMHVGGAGGRTHDEARRYLDPQTAIENRARHFRGGSGGAFAASVQRPADPSGYARKVDATIAALRAGKSPYSKALSGSSVASQRLTGANAGTPAGGNKAAAINLIFGNDPVFSMAAREPQAVSAPVAQQQRNVGGGKVALGKDYRWLKRMGEQLFGLKNDPGNSQLTGGRHSAGSEHYDGRAIDFGTARNSREQLQAWLQWARKQGLDAIDEGDHIHVSLPGSGI